MTVASSVACRRVAIVDTPDSGSRSVSGPHWQLQLSVGGGIEGRAFRATLDDDGSLQVVDHRLSSDVPAASRLAPAMLAETDGLVRSLYEAGAYSPAPPEPDCLNCPDFAYEATRLRYGGSDYWLEDRTPPCDAHYWLEEPTKCAPRNAVPGQLTRLHQILHASVEENVRKAEETEFQERNHFRLGRAWRVKEIHGGIGRTPRVMLAAWTRRGETNVFDSVWDDYATGEHGTDVIEFVSVQMRSSDSGTVTLKARHDKRRYTGMYVVYRDRRILGHETDGIAWEAEILDRVP